MHKIPIFLSADNNYAPFVATTIASICDNTKSFCDFYILDGGITEENKEKICLLKTLYNNFSIEFIQIDLEKEFEGFVVTSCITKSMYSRFLIPYLKPEINKAIYSDIDVIVLGDISEMYNENLSGYAIAAVLEAFGCNPLNKTMFGISDTHRYFSSGNLIIDCNLWRKNNIIQKIREIEKRYRNVLKFADMEILNILFQDSYKELEPKYCYINQNYFFPDIPKDIFIRHYNGAIKPWHINFDNNVINDVGLFWHYAKITMFYHELVDNCKNVDKNFILRQLKVYEMVNKAQARKRLISG